MAKQRFRGTLVFPARGASQANVDKTISEATEEIKSVVYKSVAGLEVESNKTASVTANGTLVVEPSDGKDVMEKATVTVAIPLEVNKTATIDASQYAAPVEITPSDGKTAMQIATVTVTNIPVLEANKTATITQNGTHIISPSSGKDGMENATVTVNVSGGGADLEDNKDATIDVSAYTEPVEVTPTQGKDGMKKVTVSLSNMPAGANMLYAWETNNTPIYLSINIAPSDLADVSDIKTIESSGPSVLEIRPFILEGDTYAYISNTEFTISFEEDGQTITSTFTRNATMDVEIWNAPPEVETTKQATIDVSTYDPANKPVITPTAGKQSMAEVEITLDNIPSSGELVYDNTISVDTILPSGTDVTVSNYGDDRGIYHMTADGVNSIDILFDSFSSDYDVQDIRYIGTLGSAIVMSAQFQSL